MSLPTIAHPPSTMRRSRQAPTTPTLAAPRLRRRSGLLLRDPESLAQQPAARVPGICARDDRSASWAREPEYCHVDRAPAMIASCLKRQCRRGGYRSVWEAAGRSRLLPGRRRSSRRSRGPSQACALGFETPIGLDINPRNQSGCSPAHSSVRNRCGHRSPTGEGSCDRVSTALPQGPRSTMRPAARTQVLSRRREIGNGEHG